MELRAIAQLLRRWWWLIVISTLIAGLAALPALSAATGSGGGYSTVLHFSAAQSPQEQLAPESDLQDVWLASELTVNALSAWARTESFRREISNAPGIVSGDIDARSASRQIISAALASSSSATRTHRPWRVSPMLPSTSCKRKIAGTSRNSATRRPQSPCSTGRPLCPCQYP